MKDLTESILKNLKSELERHQRYIADEMSEYKNTDIDEYNEYKKMECLVDKLEESINQINRIIYRW